MQIRLATKDDNKALLNLSKSAPQEGVITYYSDQSPDFFKLISLMGEEYNLWVADNDGRIDGCIGEIYNKVRYNNKETSLVYVGELKVHPAARGMLAITLVNHVAKEVEKRKGVVELGQGFILEGNERSKKLTDFYSKKVAKSKDAGFAETYQVLPLKKYKVPEGYKIRTMTDNDIPIVAEMLKETYKDYEMTPLFSEEWLRKELSRTESFSVKNFKIAEKNGEVAAVAAFWDQSSIRKNIVLKISAPIKLIKFTLSILRPLLKMPPIPKNGEEIKCLILRFPAVKNNDIEGLKALIHNELNEMRSNPNYHFLWVTFHENSHLKSVIEDTVKLKNRAYIKHFGLNESFQFAESEKPIYVDFSIV